VSAAALAAGLALARADPSPGVGPPRSAEVHVKAVYLYKLPPFVRWPAGAFDAPNSPFTICVAGADPFGQALDQAVTGQRVDRHPMVLKRLLRVDKGSGCHILYVGGGKAQSEADALSAVRGSPVLTVTDSASGERARGVIDFVIKDNRVRFSVDNEAARQNGLAISSKLLSLAVSVRPRLQEAAK